MSHPIDVIVPVYRGLQDVVDCLDSINASHNTTPFELIVIDDCSPEPEVSQLLRERAATGEFTLLVNEENLGFVATVNRGMQLHSERDVLLLNSDTIVVNDWLDRIVSCAHQDSNIATVTPFSNNATICSFPNFCQDNLLPAHTSLAHLDRLFAMTNAGQTIDIPTGVGFCMFIRRACLAQIGYFDVETFGKGYGEENDFCQRAAKAGWRNTLVLDTFVQHTGNVSFGDEHNTLKQGAMAKLAHLHPNYEEDVQSHILQDPARAARVRVWLASLLDSEKPIIIHICHNYGGGTLRFVNELASEISGEYYSLMLYPSVSNPGHLALAQVSADAHGAAGQESEYMLYFGGDNQYSDALQVLAQLPLAGLHFHHVIGLPTWIVSLGQQLNVPWLVSLHDYYYLSESISLTDKNGRFIGNSLEGLTPSWYEQYRDLLEQANACLAPSLACANLYQAVFPKAPIKTVYHEKGRHFEQPLQTIKPINLSHSEELKVLIIGALSQIKGADLLEQVAKLCQQRKLPVKFELLGYGYRPFDRQLADTLEVTGSYAEQDLPVMLAHRKQSGQPYLIWFPALWPETYSYTLSAALESELPILAPNLGAFPERLSQRPCAWTVPWDRSPEEFVELFSELITNGSAAPRFSCYQSRVASVGQSIDYERDYDQLLGIKQPTSILRSSSNDLLSAWLTRTIPFTQVTISYKVRMKQKALLTLDKLRRAPLLRSVARRLPKPWLRRVKEMLSR